MEVTQPADDGNAPDIIIDLAPEEEPPTQQHGMSSLSDQSRDIIEQVEEAFPAYEARSLELWSDTAAEGSNHPAARRSSTTSTACTLQQALTVVEAPGTSETRAHSEPDTRRHLHTVRFIPPTVDDAATPPPKSLIVRVRAERIHAPRDWSAERDGKPTARPFESFSHYTTVSPSTGFAALKATLVKILTAHILRDRPGGHVPARETVKAFVYIEWAPLRRRLLRIFKGKKQNVYANEENWPSIVAALRSKSVAGLKVLFWNDTQ
jgi:hypothetical protein